MWAIVPLEIHSLLYIFLEYTDFFLQPFQGELVIKMPQNFIVTVFYLQFFYGIRSKDSPIKREESETIFLVMIQPLSSYMTLVKPLYYFFESYFFTGTPRGSEYLNPNVSSSFHSCCFAQP